MQPSSSLVTAPAAPVNILPPTSTRVLAGVPVPDTPLIARAIEYVSDASESYLFNHVMRSWLFAVMLAERKGASYDAEVLAVATLLHDLGLTEAFSGHRQSEHGADPRGIPAPWYEALLHACCLRHREGASRNYVRQLRAGLW